MTQDTKTSDTPLDHTTPPKAPALKRGKNRCGVCHKKTGLTGIVCRCGITFCSLHRYPEAHQCSINYQQLGKEILSKSVLGTTSQKIEIL